MPYVSTGRFNTFWIAANIIFDLGSGSTREVLMLVNRVDDATVFSLSDAQKYFTFVTMRGKGNIVWSIDPKVNPPLVRQVQGEQPGGYVIKGVQHV